MEVIGVMEDISSFNKASCFKSNLTTVEIADVKF